MPLRRITHPEDSKAWVLELELGGLAMTGVYVTKLPYDSDDVLRIVTTAEVERPMLLFLAVINIPGAKWDNVDSGRSTIVLVLVDPAQKLMWKLTVIALSVW